MKIILAEDDIHIQYIAKTALTKLGGHTVALANNGFETLALLENEKPDVILLDVMMPQLSGFETCQLLKANQNTSHIPLIFLSAKTQSQEIEQGFKLGAKGYILKPFDPMTLHIQIEEILNKLI